MWDDTWWKYVRRNHQIAGNSFFAGSVATVLFTLGLLVSDSFYDWDQVVRLLIPVLICLCVSLAFGIYSFKIRPMYPESPLDVHEEEVERAVVSEWGEALKSLRRLIAKAENCSSHIIKTNVKPDEEGSGDVTLTRNVLIAMHGKVCDLSRAISGLAQKGYAEAAFASWRSMLELEVNMAYIASKQKDDPDVARRFIDWSEMAYLRFREPDSQELKELQSRYKGWNIKSDQGWTSRGDIVGFRRRACSVGYRAGNKPHGFEVVDIYELANAFVHNDATALSSDLGRSSPHLKGPSPEGLDLPLALAGTSLRGATETLIGSQPEPGDAALKQYKRAMLVIQNDIFIETSIVPERLASRFLKLNMTFSEPLPDGGEAIVVLQRREGTREDAMREANDFLEGRRLREEESGGRSKNQA